MVSVKRRLICPAVNKQDGLLIVERLKYSYLALPGLPRIADAVPLLSISSAKRRAAPFLPV